MVQTRLGSTGLAKPRRERQIAANGADALIFHQGAKHVGIRTHHR
jgi:hypothetical protein